MTLQQEQNIVHAIQNQTRQLKEIFQEQKHYGFYQLCPKCDGEKELYGNFFDGTTYVSRRTCPICKGEGVIPRPEVKNMQP